MEPKSAYHSFNDVELFEPSSPAKIKLSHQAQQPAAKHDRQASESSPEFVAKIQRQDSGYESYNTTPRTSSSYTRPHPTRRISTPSVTAAGLPNTRPRTRPSTRRSTTSQSSPPGHAIRAARTATDTTANQPSTYFYFPAPTTSAEIQQNPEPVQQASSQFNVVSPVPPPQTTHYWTSDSTRRLEYAAIDASCRGFKGWARRNLVPSCFTGGEDRHVSFDDDSGSVRRYRLELDDDECGKEVETLAGKGRAGKRWQVWGGR